MANWPLVERGVFDALSPRVRELSACSVEPTAGVNDGSEPGSRVHPHTRLLGERRPAGGDARL